MTVKLSTTQEWDSKLKETQRSPPSCARRPHDWCRKRCKDCNFRENANNRSWLQARKEFYISSQKVPLMKPCKGNHFQVHIHYVLTHGIQLVIKFLDGTVVPAFLFKLEVSFWGKDCFKSRHSKRLKPLLCVMPMTSVMIEFRELYCLFPWILPDHGFYILDHPKWLENYMIVPKHVYQEFMVSAIWCIFHNV